jgi:hypothetical protein
LVGIGIVAGAGAVYAWTQRDKISAAKDKFSVAEAVENLKKSKGYQDVINGLGLNDKGESK